MIRTRTRGPALAVLSAAQFLIALDYSIVYVALPAVGADLRLTGAYAQWIVSAYAVVFAGLLILGGRLTDRIGGRRVFLTAVLLFGLASAAGGTAGNGTELVAARAVQGLGAALLQPAVLGLIGTTFPPGPRRARALAVWGSVGACGLAAGVILGGALTTLSWRLIFAVNVPLTILCALGALTWLNAPPARGPAPAPTPGPAPGLREAGGGSVGDGARVRVPVRATVLGTGAVLAVTLGLTCGAVWGWRAVPATGGVLLGAGLAVWFVRHERAAPAVLIDRALRGAVTLRYGAVAAALYMASVGSEFYLLTLLLQALKGYRPLLAGLAFLPAALLVTGGSASAGRAMRRWPPGRVLAAGFAISAAGLAWLALTAHGDAYARDLLPGLLLSGYGHGMVYTSTFALGTRDVPAGLQGSAGALLTTAQYVSGAVTVAVLTLILGPAPGPAAFRAAFLVTAAAAAAGLAPAVRSAAGTPSRPPRPRSRVRR